MNLQTIATLYGQSVAVAPPTLPTDLTILRGTRVDPQFDQLPDAFVRTEVLHALRDGTARREFFLDTPQGTLALRVSGIVRLADHGAMIMIDWSHGAILADAQARFAPLLDEWTRAIYTAADTRDAIRERVRSQSDRFTQLLSGMPDEVLDRFYWETYAATDGQDVIDIKPGLFLGQALRTMPARMRRDRLNDLAAALFTEARDTSTELYNVYVSHLWFGPPPPDPDLRYDHVRLMAAHPDHPNVQRLDFSNLLGSAASLCAYIDFAPIGGCAGAVTKP